MKVEDLKYFSMQEFDSLHINELTYEDQLLASNKNFQSHLYQLIPKSILFVRDFLLADCIIPSEELNIDSLSLANMVICVNARLFPEQKAESVKTAILIKLIIHEIAQQIIGYYLNNQFFYLLTPQKIYDFDSNECRNHVEEHIFGQIENQDISEEMAELINNASNYENVEKLRDNLQKLIKFDDSNNPSSQKNLKKTKIGNNRKKKSRKGTICGTHTLKRKIHEFF